jgi:hypothetical protein
MEWTIRYLGASQQWLSNISSVHGLVLKKLKVADLLFLRLIHSLTDTFHESRTSVTGIFKNKNETYRPSIYFFYKLDNDAPPSPSWNGIPSLSVVAANKDRANRMCTAIVMDIESTAYESDQQCRRN